MALLSSTQIDFDPTALTPKPRAFLLLALEANDALAGGGRFGLDGLDEVTVGRGPREHQRLKIAGRDVLEIHAPSPILSKQHARFCRNGNAWTVEEVQSKNGVFVNWKAISGAATLTPGDVIALGQLYFIFHVEATERLADVDGPRRPEGPPGMVSLVPEMERRLRDLKNEATKNTPITIVGETGTGKEVTASAIHVLSRRRGRYIAVNCGAIPKDLIQSELFGHEEGAFTGARRFGGQIRDAEKGTFLLDEVIEAPEPVQISLLRFLEQRTVTPLGSSEARPVDVRVVVAAQKPLSEAVREGRFRGDLEARLDAYTIELLPLRERIADLGILIADILRAQGVRAEDKPRFTTEAAARLLRYGWSKNIRGLRNVIARAWGRQVEGEMNGRTLEPLPKEVVTETVNSQERQLVALLRLTKGNIAEVARRMNRSRGTIDFFMKRFGLDPKSFRSG
jgi:DNA-binding NtrC family response regulator